MSAWGHFFLGLYSTPPTAQEYYDNISLICSATFFKSEYIVQNLNRFNSISQKEHYIPPKSSGWSTLQSPASTSMEALIQNLIMKWPQVLITFSSRMEVCSTIPSWFTYKYLSRVRFNSDTSLTSHPLAVEGTWCFILRSRNPTSRVRLCFSECKK